MTPEQKQSIHESAHKIIDRVSHEIVVDLENATDPWEFDQKKKAKVDAAADEIVAVVESELVS